MTEKATQIFEKLASWGSMASKLVKNKGMSAGPKAKKFSRELPKPKADGFIVKGIKKRVDKMSPEKRKKLGEKVMGIAKHIGLK